MDPYVISEKQRAGLIVNWLGREAAQILASVESDVNSLNEIFEMLEKVFRPESNQTLANLKFRNLKQPVRHAMLTCLSSD